jgi:putative membrane protein
MLANMSVRFYGGPHSDRGKGAPRWSNYVPWVFAGITILGQIIWILVQGDVRAFFTILTVVTFFLTSVTHAYFRRGLSWTLSFFSITLVYGWCIEALGTATSFPFGPYTYSGIIGPSLGPVPIIIPLAWSMMAYPVRLAVQRLVSAPMATAFIGGWLLASWDLFLDPMMVGEGYWTWQNIGWVLPGIPDIPLQNFLGWLLGSIGLMYALNLLPRKVAKDHVPNTMLIWIYFSNILAAAVFLGTPAVAIWGGVCMGLVMIPWMWRIWSQPQW